MTKAGGYSDLMLVNGNNGDIVYTYAKNDDFATNLVDGPYSDTHLGQMVQQIMNEKEVGKVYMTDFALYEPTGGIPVSFVATFLNSDVNRTNGILIYELSIDNIDALMKDQTGLGEPGKTSGETYLVGADNLMRSNSPLADQDTFFNEEVRVDTPAVTSGLEGKTGFIPKMISYRDTTVLSAYQPVDLIGDVEWVLLAEIEEQEALQTVATVRNGIVVLVILVGGLAVALGLFIALRISRRIEHLTYAARQIMNGDFMVQVPVESQDETGELAEAFTTMTAQLRELIGSLEDQVAERTRGLETVVDISQRLAGILDVSDLVQQVVILTKERFDYYHVHVYLVDEPNKNLVLAEGYGQVGVEMKRREHSIELSASQSLVARAARQRHIVLAENVEREPDWLPNDLLPNTRAEMAVPIITGQKVVGVLDVQSDEIGGLTEEDGAVLWALANQVAVAVRNAESFSETQRALTEAQKVQQMYTGQAWERFSATRPTTDYEIRQTALPPIAQITTPEAVTAAQHKQTIHLRIGSDGQPGTGTEAGSETAMATPLKIGDEVIGVLGIRDEDPDRRWTEEEIALIEAVSEQMSLALENARLFEETGRRAGRERIIADVTRQIWASGELDYVMRTAVEQLGKTLDASKVVIRLGTEERLLKSNGTDNGKDSDNVDVADGIDSGNLDAFDDAGNIDVPSDPDDEQST
jgi:GAF domain-containing protein/HAMP domain-containing protein